ncbi:glycoside hydrolase [Dentipellis sp. KUC8613]|nr:glycoside hydrolase [Dentipellis sp. KUC8613]
MHMFAYVLAAAGLLQGATAAFNMDSATNVAVYWGQNSNGTQKDLGSYCNDTSIDTIMLSFLNIFKGQGGQPQYDFSNACSQGNGVFPGTNLPQCQFLASQIKTCQDANKIVTLSLGGGGTNSVGFDNDDDAQSFAGTIWNEFLGGNSSTRPLGNVSLDGVDLDIESGSDQHYDTFVNQLRTLANGAPKPLYVTGAPQCVQPDSHLNAAMLNSSLDAIYVQFYNNEPCYLPNTAGFNFAAWDDFARNKAKNPKMKVYIGAPASDEAAQSGFVNIDTFKQIITSVQKNFTSFGGVMLYDASQAQANDNYEVAVKSTLLANAGTNAPSKRDKAEGEVALV